MSYTIQKLVDINPTLAPEHRQQLWNYMRLTGIQIGILYNFAPIHDQCERYYLDKENQVMCMF